MTKRTFLAHSGDCYEAVSHYASKLSPTDADAASEAVHATLMTCLDAKGDTLMTLPDARRYWCASVQNHLFPTKQAANRETVELTEAIPSPGSVTHDYHQAWSDFITDLLTAIDNLTEPQRDVLLRLAAGTPTYALARETGVPYPTLEHRLKRARKNLLKQFAARYYALLETHPDLTDQYPIFSLFTLSDDE